MRAICYWCDGTWCDYQDLEDYSWMSDDYTTIEVPWDIEDDDIDTIVFNHTN